MPTAISKFLGSVTSLFEKLVTSIQRDTFSRTWHNPRAWSILLACSSVSFHYWEVCFEKGLQPQENSILQNCWLIFNSNRQMFICFKTRYPMRWYGGNFREFSVFAQNWYRRCCIGKILQFLKRLPWCRVRLMWCHINCWLLSSQLYQLMYVLVGVPNPRSTEWLFVFWLTFFVAVQSLRTSIRLIQPFLCSLR